MKRKLYYRILKITRSTVVAKVVSSCCYYILMWICMLLVQTGIWGKTSRVKAEDARKQLEQYSPKPESDLTKEYYITDSEDNNRKGSHQLSIIVPAYNAEGSIERCIQSVLLQKTKVDYELIIVNDGSTDKTGEILKQYQDDARIRVITQKNRGFSGARNAGIAMATGSYLAFLDSDDELMPGAVEKLMTLAQTNRADIAAGNFETVYPHKVVKSDVTNCVMCLDSETDLGKILNGFAWGKVFKREFFQKVQFPEGYWFEDTMLYFLIYRLAEGHTIASTSEVVYRYYKNENGITATYRQNKKCLDAYWITEKMMDETFRIGLPIDETTFRLMYNQLIVTYWRTRMMKKEIREAIFVLSCELMQKVFPVHQKDKDTEIDKLLLRAYQNRNFDLWNVACALR